jgi:hypothetical protein
MGADCIAIAIRAPMVTAHRPDRVRYGSVMQEETFWLVVAAAAIVIAVSFAVIAWALVRIANESRRAAVDARALMTVLQKELPPTLTALQRTADSLDQLAGEGAARLVTADRLAEEADATMAAVRDLSHSVHDIVRGPADTVSGVKRSARMVGDTVASGADKLRRRLTGSPDEHGEG